jgi:hypothetical protein
LARRADERHMIRAAVAAVALFILGAFVPPTTS